MNGKSNAEHRCDVPIHNYQVSHTNPDTDRLKCRLTELVVMGSESTFQELLRG